MGFGGGESVPWPSHPVAMAQTRSAVTWLGVPIAIASGVSDTVRPDVPFGALLRHLDDLVAEHAQLRERLTAALHREDPFFPDRRHTYQPREPDRRKR